MFDSLHPCRLHLPRAVLLEAVRRELATLRTLNPRHELGPEELEDFEAEEERWEQLEATLVADPNPEVYVGLFPAKLIEVPRYLPDLPVGLLS